MASSDPVTAPPKAPARRSQRTRLIVGGGLGALVIAFAVLNLEEVDVNWFFGTASTPLIVVILLCIAVGMAIDRALVYRGRRQESTRRR